MIVSVDIDVWLRDCCFRCRFVLLESSDDDVVTVLDSNTNCRISIVQSFLCFTVVTHNYLQLVVVLWACWSSTNKTRS